MKIHNIWVNSSGTAERSYSAEAFHKGRPLDAAIADVAKDHPSWSSMVITIVNPQPIRKD